MIQDHRISVAPMLGLTDRHARYLLRLIAPHVMLYTEMITTPSLLLGQRRDLLQYNEAEHQLVIQLAGNNARDLTKCAKMAEAKHYDEINLNVGCPSDRIQSGKFGACLMLEPQLVAECVQAMRDAVNIPISVKCRIGVDNVDSYGDLHRFVDLITRAGCKHVIIHARKAWLRGLNPRKNRSVPPLKYDVVYRIKEDFPDITVTINGGITKADSVLEHLEKVDGVMIGRRAYYDPFFLAKLEKTVYQNPRTPTVNEVIDDYLTYMQQQLACGTAFAKMAKHLLVLFKGHRGARLWRQHLSKHMYEQNASLDVVHQALKFVL